jgi:putative phage-type endonuclease
MEARHMTADLIQGSPEWIAARLGKVTASRVADVIAKTKTGWGVSRKNYAAELVAERLTGVAAERYTNAAMQWGTDTEPQARAAYEFFRDATVQQVGFIDHPRIAMSGASPDGLVGTDGMLELKCPNTATHIDTLLTKAVPQNYFTQMQWQLACSGRLWCDYCTFDPRMPQHLRIFTFRVARDEKFIAEAERAVIEFLVEIDATIAALGKLAA